MHRRGCRGFHLAAQELPEELRGLDLGEAANPQPPDHAGPFHVGDQSHGFGDEGDLLGSNGRHQEDGTRDGRSDHVAKEPEAVVVSPLEIVYQQGNRTLAGERLDGHGGQVEGPKQLPVGGEAVQAGIVVA